LLKKPVANKPLMSRIKAKQEMPLFGQWQLPLLDRIMDKIPLLNQLKRYSLDIPPPKKV
jgi:hypothetical protein